MLFIIRAQQQFEFKFKFKFMDKSKFTRTHKFINHQCSLRCGSHNVLPSAIMHDVKLHHTIYVEICAGAVDVLNELNLNLP